MLTIRKEQAAVFEEASRLDFENRMMAHIKKFFPEHFATLEEGKTRQLIQFAIERAATHGIVNERDVCKFTDLMVAFGPGFEQDPKCPWAAKILTDTAATTPSKRVDTLYDQGISRLETKAARES